VQAVSGSGIPFSNPTSFLRDLPGASGAQNQEDNERVEYPSSPVDAFDLNYADRQQLISESALLSAAQRHFLEVIETKREEFSDGIPNAYFDNGYLILGLATESFAARYICCGRPQGTCSIYCNKWFVCERCAQRQVAKSFARYADSFHKGTFHFLTISFHGDLPFTETTNTQILDHWEAINSAVEEMCNSGIWTGAYWVDELAVNSFLPLRVNPHAHAIIHAVRISEADLEDLNNLISSYQGDDDIPVEITLSPSILHRSIPSQRDFENTIAYLTKAINLVKPYNAAWREHITSNPGNAYLLNREARELLEGLPELLKQLKGKRRLRCKGTLDSRNKHFIGTRFDSGRIRKSTNTKRRKRSLS
jgi:hypothetical protein